MTLDKSRTFQYVKIENDGRRYFCLQQNLVILAWILYFKNNPLLPIVRSETKTLSLRFVIRWFRNFYTRFKRNAILVITFARYKYQLRTIDSVVTLPLYGQICAPAHKGYKVFDICREKVTKIFAPEVHTSSISREIEQMKTVAQIAFAPALRRWNIQERWYEEDYVNGSLDSSYKPMDSSTLGKRFSQDLVPHLTSLILFKQVKTRISVDYIKDVLAVLEFSRLATQEFTVKDFNHIKSFLDSTVERLRIEANCSVFLVFTHGDFCPANMLNTKHGIKIIDWESAGYRSALFDFYSYFFYRPVSRNVPVRKIVFEINEALPIFISSLAKKESLICNSLRQLEKVYRWIYYIEEVCKGIEREMTDKNLNIRENILRYIGAFNCYEEILSDKVDNFPRVARK